ncbi:hypothetical protein SOM12_08475 [Flavobacterium sp. CFBP9031]|jgi:hypothetical protein|uniref:hypothetical protein n=1 Tax=unclassified Flavobacterium TaxID=196869 RepID=UPI002A6B0BB2|nr:hypothetical protein [Flavobacterium sp. CFBP9031]MDY0987446.1 hypothetical protein [Flavobacterium sp. CFBP9031]
MKDDSVSEELFLSEAAKAHLQTAGKWVYVMSSFGLLIIAFFILRLLYDYMSLSNWDDVPTGGGVGYIMIMSLLPIFIIAFLIILFPLYYLYKFSLNVKIAFRDDDSEALEISFRYLKMHYMALGIGILAYVGLYFLMSKFF